MTKPTQIDLPDPEIGQLMQAVPGWQGRACESITLLADGLTSISWQVRVAGALYVLKRNKFAVPAPGTDRTRELAVLEQAAAAGLGPQPVFADSESGLMLTRFVEGQALDAEALREPSTLARVCATLQVLHDLPVTMPAMSLPTLISEYSDNVLQTTGATAHALNRLRGPLEQVVGDWSTGIEQPCLCHNDLLHSNMLDNGQIVLIDWEYAGVGDRLFDLATLTRHQNFTAAETRNLLTLYFDEPSAHIIRRMHQTEIIVELVFALWLLACRALAETELAREAGSDRSLLENIAVNVRRYQRAAELVG